jgi:hypothetical protein
MNQKSEDLTGVKTADFPWGGEMREDRGGSNPRGRAANRPRGFFLSALYLEYAGPLRSVAFDPAYPFGAVCLLRLPTVPARLIGSTGSALSLSTPASRCSVFPYPDKWFASARACAMRSAGVKRAMRDRSQRYEKEWTCAWSSYRSTGVCTS